MSQCPACSGLGWLLNEHHAGNGPKDSSLPLSLDLLPCIYPDCDATIRPIAVFSIRGQFANVVRHPKDNTVIALTEFTEAIYR